MKSTRYRKTNITCSHPHVEVKTLVLKRRMLAIAGGEGGRAWGWMREWLMTTGVDLDRKRASGVLQRKLMRLKVIS